MDDLAAELGKSMTSIAIGSEEGFTQADKAINTASKNGRWVLLKNVHLAPSWLVTLEKKLHSMSVHSAFRLFLTCEITPKVCQHYLRSNVSDSYLKIAFRCWWNISELGQGQTSRCPPKLSNSLPKFNWLPKP